jgi:hypothetical protein
MAEILKEIRRFGNEQIEVIFRKSAPISDPEVRCAGFYSGGKYDSHLLVPAIPP